MVKSDYAWVREDRKQGSYIIRKLYYKEVIVNLELLFLLALNQVTQLNFVYVTVWFYQSLEVF